MSAIELVFAIVVGIVLAEFVLGWLDKAGLLPGAVEKDPDDWWKRGERPPGEE